MCMLYCIHIIIIRLRSHTQLHERMRFRMFSPYHYNGHIIFGNIISRIKPTAAGAEGDVDGGAGAINVVCRVISPQPGPVAVCTLLLLYYVWRAGHIETGTLPEIIHTIMYAHA